MEPSYLKLYRTGELEKRLIILEKMLESCSVCPRDCGTNRFNHEQGFCLAEYDPLVSSVCDHHGEEPVLSGVNGSGTVFFGSCNLRCVYCQNHQISQNRSYFSGLSVKTSQLAKNIVALQNDKGVHNINFVSPSHFVPQMVRAIYEAIPLGLRVPIIYNTNAYDSLAVIKLLDGIVDIYLPDLKYDENAPAEKYSRGLNYTYYARAAIKEMYRQVGNLKVDKKGIAQRGLIVRHLILPNDISGTKNVLTWLAKEISGDVTISLMSQYHPMHKSSKHNLLSRQISYNEYLSAVAVLEKLNMYNSYIQEMDAPEHYLPDFSNDGHPFER